MELRPEYGSNTKQWRFDCVANMTPLNDKQLEEIRLLPGETGFNLSFDAPAGKARRRTPSNYHQFEKCVVRLANDEWTRDGAADAKTKSKVRPSDRKFYSALLDAIAATGRNGKTTEDAWISECTRRGLMEALEPDDDWRARDSKRKSFRTAKSNLIKADVIGYDGKTVMLVHT